MNICSLDVLATYRYIPDTATLQNAPAEEGMKFLCYYYKDRKEYDKSYRMASAMLDYSVRTQYYLAK